MDKYLAFLYYYSNIKCCCCLLISSHFTDSRHLISHYIWEREVIRSNQHLTSLYISVSFRVTENYNVNISLSTPIIDTNVRGIYELLENEWWSYTNNTMQRHCHNFIVIWWILLRNFIFPNFYHSNINLMVIW